VSVKYLTRTLTHSPIHYGLCLSEKDLLREAKRLKAELDPSDFPGPEDHAMTVFFEDGKGARRALVCIDWAKHKDPDTILASLIHESVHVWQEIARYIGEAKPGSEQQAYSIERIAMSLIREYRRKAA
jgi:hypothetical protein